MRSAVMLTALSITALSATAAAGAGAETGVDGELVYRQQCARCTAQVRPGEPEGDCLVATTSYNGSMITVGVRELKNRLSEHLRMVRRGEEILVTHRGEVVAELRQPSRVPAAVTYPGLVRHARAGKARIGGPNRRDLYPSQEPFLPPGSARRLLDEERGDR